MGVRDRRGGGVGEEGQPQHPPTPSTTSIHPAPPPTHTSFLIVGERSFHVFYQLISDRKLCAERATPPVSCYPTYPTTQPHPA